jgi:DMSO/TMAO reductase YedYZ heme-binding membrane subunit
MPKNPPSSQKPAYHSRWWESLVIAAVVIGLVTLYFRIRNPHIDVFYLNKIAGAVAATLAGLTLLVGPLLSYKPERKSLIGFRRPLGLLAFGCALLHVTLLLFFLGQRFPLAYYQKEWLPVGFGILAGLGWVYLVYLSRDSQVLKLGFPRWKQLQNWGGRLGFTFVFLHISLLKYEGWIQWITKDPKGPAGLVNSPYPPSSLVVFGIMSVIIVYRVGHMIFGPKRST